MCPCCNGPVGFLGQLGNLQYWRCQNCGMDCHNTAPRDDDGDEIVEMHPGGIQ